MKGDERALSAGHGHYLHVPLDFKAVIHGGIEDLHLALFPVHLLARHAAHAETLVVVP